jgi:hypothetical protein
MSLTVTLLALRLALLFGALVLMPTCATVVPGVGLGLLYVTAGLTRGSTWLFVIVAAVGILSLLALIVAIGAVLVWAFAGLDDNLRAARERRRVVARYGIPGRIAALGLAASLTLAAVFAGVTLLLWTRLPA